ncbi:hypothetical protein METBIDRAFT_116728 [Metschnikowia bicuspidata var. bicuspidata NRRL YB-4993]|uniref:Uncharacterized protein n=1 Tax=Metschnikowia bicuspidata var. bicuspidata NRRL YB-4993 TaxID=869754 RepID=A0A1A0HJ70_9ASCO|nr:hypothetical protein METBIDRAFT_116728 [Metschnikowia bicuspidata var. bicuspidata NRRL YB-4993]OBA24046.1 hypothetical protein METBIDRAFT_116728 [Metschnikowia bicuspidata var. bicuspidata NRRL YB-4993]
MIENVMIYSMCMPKAIEMEITNAKSEASKDIITELENQKSSEFFLVKNNINLIKKYFPNIQEKRDRFRNENRTIASAMLKNLPFLVKENEVSRQKMGDVGHVIATKVDSTKIWKLEKFYRLEKFGRAW